MRKIFSYFSPYKYRMILGLLIKMIGTFSELFLPLIMAYMIDEVSPTKNLYSLTFWSIAMLLCAVGGLVGNVIANRMASKVARDTTERIRNDLFTKTLSLSSKQIDQVTIPSLVSRLSNDTYNVHNMIGMMQRIGVRAPILLVGGIILTFVVDPYLASILLLTTPFITLVVVLISKYGTILYAKLQEANDILVRKVRDDYTGIRVIKALSKTKYESKTFSTLNQEVLKREKKATLLTGISNPLLNVVLNLGMCLVIYLGAYRVSGNYIKAGDIIAFTSYFSIVQMAIISISRIFVMYTKGGASCRRIEEILLMDKDLIKEEDTKLIKDDNFITFDKVDFEYDNVKALKNVSFSIKKGESLGIIGATGSGKSTIINLLLRFYDPTNGVIYLNGKNLKNYDYNELKSKIGVVFQNDFLMSGTIKENVDFSRNLKQENIYQALKNADAEAFVEEHGGEDSILLTKGSNFSGGQKQRLLIARALASNPELLILDDSSSALDYKTDTKLRKTLINNYKNTTIIMIAQRISSIKFADHILVLDKGKVVGFGSDKELIKTCKVYQDIYCSQHEDDLTESKGSEIYG